MAKSTQNLSKTLGLNSFVITANIKNEIKLEKMSVNAGGKFAILKKVYISIKRLVDKPGLKIV